MRCPKEQNAAHPACATLLTASSGSCRRPRPERACPHSPSETYLPYPHWPPETIPCDDRKVRSRSGLPGWPHNSFPRKSPPYEDSGRESHVPPVPCPSRTRHKSELGHWSAP